MHLDLTEEQRGIQDAARRFAREVLEPAAADLDKGENRGTFLANIKTLAELGFMGLNVSADYGGSEAGTVAFSLAITEIARACASTAVTMSVTNMVAEIIEAVGSIDQKNHYLPLLCGGEYPAGAFCLSETGAGSDPSGMKTRAVRNGDDWVINGSKMWITSGEYAGVFVVWAVTDPEKPSGKGISCFLVEADSPGITVAPAEEKMGQKASATNAVHFDNCRVSASALMGKENDGFRIAVGELAGGRIGIGSLALGIGSAAMDLARDYTTDRRQFGKPISNFQGVQWQLADTYTELEAARLLLMNAAFQKEQRRDFGKAASMAKLYATESANRACYTAIQLLGGYGYTQEYPLERMARDVRVTSIYEGTSEIQRVIIARAVLAEAAA